MLGLFSLRNDLENDLIEDIKKKQYLIESKQQNNGFTFGTSEVKKSEISKILENLIIAYEYNLDNYLATFMAKNFHFIWLTYYDGSTSVSKDDMAYLITHPSFPKEIAYELVKNSIKILFHDIDKENKKFLDIHKDGYAEMLSILNFFDNVFYEDDASDAPTKTKKKIFYRKIFQYNTSAVIGKISCADDFKDQATLIIEGRRIHVKSFILTDNSPVFKAMLQSTSFKEGQTKSIELPGKSLNEMVYLF